MKDWQFTGTFSDFETPRKLNQLMTWIISGAYNNLNEKRDTALEKSSRNLTQHIISSYRTRRQLIYQSKADSKFQKQKRTQLSVGLSLTSYHSNRSKSDIQTLNSIDLATPYNDVQRTTSRIALAAIDDMRKNSQGVHLPPFVRKGIWPVFAIDNIEWGSDACSFHGADLLIAQPNADGTPLLESATV